MADIPPPPSPKWKRPDEVMRMHLMKKRRALAARMNCSDPTTGHSLIASPSSASSSGVSAPNARSRRNCFRRGSGGVKRNSDGEPVITDVDAASDENTLFHLLNVDSSPTPSAHITPTSFSSILSSLPGPEKSSIKKKSKREYYIPIDWTLRTKVRFISPKPFAFSGTLRTCEEASGITGFVRCLDTGQRNSTLDTSPNARLHQCCLVWQHPWLPWLELYPRQAARVSATDGTMNIAAMPAVKDSLQWDWAKSLQSLFQLVRARQCPYFYVCANNFTCLFRAAGICGSSEINALVTPTTRGFRQILKEEDVEYTMPLKKTSAIKRRSLDSESGYETMDSQASESNPVAVKQEEVREKEEGDCEEEDVSNDKWLESMGLEASEIRRLNTVQVQQTIDRERDIDKTPESLIMVEGVETQALFNFLLNCKSCISTTGPLAGIPPTLLAPAAFHGATLRPIKVRVSKVQLESDSFHSVELQGPVLPHSVLGLCDLLHPSSDQFSLTFANLDSTKAFSQADHAQATSITQDDIEKENTATSTSVWAAPSVFGQENLSDCGLSKTLLETFCNPDVSRVQPMESLKYSDGLYTWA